MARPRSPSLLIPPNLRPYAPRDPPRASQTPYPSTPQDASVVPRISQHAISTPSSAPFLSHSTFRYPTTTTQQPAMTARPTAVMKKPPHCGGITQYSRPAPRRTSAVHWTRYFPLTPRKIHRWQEAATTRVGGGLKCSRDSPAHGCGRRDLRTRSGLGRSIVVRAVSHVVWR
jgi:hypothetical protein